MSNIIWKFIVMHSQLISIYSKICEQYRKMKVFKKKKILWLKTPHNFTLPREVISFLFSSWKRTQICLLSSAAVCACKWLKWWWVCDFIQVPTCPSFRNWFSCRVASTVSSILLLHQKQTNPLVVVLDISRSLLNQLVNIIKWLFLHPRPDLISPRLGLLETRLFLVLPNFLAFHKLINRTCKLEGICTYVNCDLK